VGRLARHPAAHLLGRIRRDGRPGPGLPRDVPGVPPRVDLAEERRRRADAGAAEWFGEDDLYPDVRPVLAELRDAGYWLGVAGNQTTAAGKILRELALPVDMVATSEDWGASKPDASFFERLIESVPYVAGEVLYVGDRLDNDIQPAANAGISTALIRRGPWGIIQENEPAAARVPTIRIASLRELPGEIAKLNAVAR
jgi:HAD superfamily hydrolase (TIGR01662 family)